MNLYFGALLLRCLATALLQPNRQPGRGMGHSLVERWNGMVHQAGRWVSTAAAVQEQATQLDWRRCNPSHVPGLASPKQQLEMGDWPRRDRGRALLWVQDAYTCMCMCFVPPDHKCPGWSSTPTAGSASTIYINQLDHSVNLKCILLSYYFLFFIILYPFLNESKWCKAPNS